MDLPGLQKVSFLRLSAPSAAASCRESGLLEATELWDFKSHPYLTSKAREVPATVCTDGVAHCCGLHFTLHEAPGSPWSQYLFWKSLCMLRNPKETHTSCSALCSLWNSGDDKCLLEDAA